MSINDGRTKVAITGQTKVRAKARAKVRAKVRAKARAIIWRIQQATWATLDMDSAFSIDEPTIHARPRVP